MKQLLTIFALLLLCMAGYAAETYVVNSPNLNMRVILLIMLINLLEVLI